MFIQVPTKTNLALTSFNLSSNEYTRILLNGVKFWLSVGCFVIGYIFVVILNIEEIVLFFLIKRTDRQ